MYHVASLNAVLPSAGPTKVSVARSCTCSRPSVRSCSAHWLVRASREEEKRLVRPGVARLAEREAEPQGVEGRREARGQDARGRGLVQAAHARARPDGRRRNGRSSPQGCDLGCVPGLEADELDDGVEDQRPACVVGADAEAETCVGGIVPAQSEGGLHLDPFSPVSWYAYGRSSSRLPSGVETARRPSLVTRIPVAPR